MSLSTAWPVLAGSNVMNLLLFFFLEAMTHFSFGNLYMMNVWDTLCMYAHTRHRCRMNIFFVLMCLQFYSFEFCIINCHTFDRNVYSAFDSFFGVLLGFVINLHFCSNDLDQIRFHCYTKIQLICNQFKLIPKGKKSMTKLSLW